MAKNLLIVESPAKAKTIEKYLGKDYQVLSSYGHIRDLPKSGLNIDVENNFEPTYEIPAESKKTIASLKKAIKGKTVWLATDEDREGEAISWHLCKALQLDSENTKRIVFHEITKQALLDAVSKPRTVDHNLVDAQQARRVLDRLVGYELSPVLMKKIRRPGLSAGRVQSVAVRIIVEREREIEAFKPKSSYKVTAEFATNNNETIIAELKNKLSTKSEVEEFLQSLLGAKYHVASLDKKSGKKSPSPPFTTSTLQQAASNKLGFSVRQTMVLAQKLYESGKITYMRTDSLNLSTTAIEHAKKTIKESFGDQYVNTRSFKTKSSGAQEAHEAIRPTDFASEIASNDSKQQKLYQLIRARALASQMSDAQTERTIVVVGNNKNDKEFVTKGEIIVFDGFLKVYGKMTDETLLPPLTIDQELKSIKISAKSIYDKPPARYTEASLVKKLESEGIGRPSTYAPTISTIQYRGYVEKLSKDGAPRDVEIIELENDKIMHRIEQENFGVEKNKLFPTDTGKIVNDFLVKYFADIVDYQFTVKAEEEFDKIAEGKMKWNSMISEFYKPFHKLIKSSKDINPDDVSQARILGKDPKSGKPVIARLGRYGGMLQIGEVQDEDKPKFAPLPKDCTIENVTLEKALEMFKLPRILGKTSKGEEISTNIGRFGPYVKFDDKFVSIKDDDPFSITLEKAIELIEQKKKADSEKVIADFKKDKIQILNGRYGPYITDGKTNVKIPKDTDPKKIDVKTAQQMLSQKSKK
ncbi:MAG TPA: type I DNA topoisomerase [Candidatus Saccharibacteria bacterium]|nr:type I DNA topoisomerase [Candidatus Saccharibacteria bacterium]HMT39483.1 type I DNA topoisomerase [Candidatus Saccharibacteria bacterium]